MRSEDVNTRISMRLWEVAETSRRRVEADLYMRAYCTLKQFTILELIESTYENVIASALARRLSCSRANVTQLLREMRQHRWVSLTPAHRDARATIMRVTDNGRTAYRLTARLLADAAYGELDALEVEEKPRLVSILRKLATR